MLKISHDNSDIFVAVRSGNAQTVSDLLETTKNIDSSLITEALAKNNSEIARMLIKRKNELGTLSPMDGAAYDWFYYASGFGMYDVFDLLSKCGFEMNDLVVEASLFGVNDKTFNGVVIALLRNGLASEFDTIILKAIGFGMPMIAKIIKTLRSYNIDVKNVIVQSNKPGIKENKKLLLTINEPERDDLDFLG